MICRMRLQVLHNREQRLLQRSDQIQKGRLLSRPKHHNDPSVFATNRRVIKSEGKM